MKQKQLLSSAEAIPAKGQHTKPCRDCPWSRGSLAGWTGSMTPDQWIAAAHGESIVECHTLIGAQCAGLAIYRRNVVKTPRAPEALILPADRLRVFGSFREFLDHHNVFKRRKK